MQKTFLLFVVLCFSFGLAYSEASYFQDSETTIFEIREIPNFRKMDIQGHVNVIFADLETNLIKVVALKKQLPEVITKVEDETLFIQFNAVALVNSPVKVYIPTHQLEAILIKDQATVSNELELYLNTLELTAFDRSEVHLNQVIGKTLFLNLKGEAKVSLKGSFESQNVTIAGFCRYDGTGLLTKEAKVYASGHSNSVINVAETLFLNALDSATIQYYGNPKVEQKKSLQSIIKHLEDQELYQSS